ncbi:hypothetical protein KCU61_g281, partial [Aureobasidium melanogenum]
MLNTLSLTAEAAAAAVSVACSVTVLVSSVLGASAATSWGLFSASDMVKFLLSRLIVRSVNTMCPSCPSQ